MTITTAQIRGARGILGWSQQDLAQRTGISATSIGAIENNQTTPRESTLATIRKAFESGGIEFIGLDGVRVQTSYTKRLRGSQGFSDFLDDVYHTAILHGTKEKPTEVFLSNVVHKNWIKWMGPEKWKIHTERMTKDRDVMDVRIIVKEKDLDFPASAYSKYKWFPENLFNDKSFYSYHDKLAFLDFNENDVEILIMQQPAFAEGYRNLFRIAWDNLAVDPQTNEVKVKRVK